MSGRDQSSNVPFTTGEPSCTRCHGYHGIEATGIDEIIGWIADNCQECHQVASSAWELGREIDENLGVAMSFLDSLRNMSEDFRLAGVETGGMDKLNQEAHGWLLRVESAIHSVDTEWEELTGMAKVKMMASWDLGRDYNLEKGIRKIILLLIALLAVSIFALLAFKLKLAERDQRRRQLLGSPEARQREQEHHKNKLLVCLRENEHKIDGPTIYQVCRNHGVNRSAVCQIMKDTQETCVRIAHYSEPVIGLPYRRMYYRLHIRSTAMLHVDGVLFIQSEQDGGIIHECSGDGDSLLLATR